MPATLAISTWLIVSAAFMWSENYFDGPEKENMTSLPSTLYWCTIFSIGEWANVDFSFGAGSRCCIFVCFFAICIITIPVGIIAEAVADSIKTIMQEREELARLYGIGKFFTNDAAASAYQSNMGAPMIPGYFGYGPTANSQLIGTEEGPNFEPTSMPRGPFQERAMLVPRPPGALFGARPAAEPIAEAGGQGMFRGTAAAGAMPGMRPPGPPGGQMGGRPPLPGQGNGATYQRTSGPSE